MVSQEGGVAARSCEEHGEQRGRTWLKNCKLPAEQVLDMLNLRFAHVLSLHGAFVIGDTMANTARPSNA